MTTSVAPRTSDRIEALVSTIDAYEPAKLAAHADLFRVFARFVSRSVDARQLDRHPTAELLPDVEQLLEAGLVRTSDQLIAKLLPADDGADRRGVLVTCMPDQNFLYSTVRLALDHLGITAHRALTSVVPIRRNARGAIDAVGLNESPRESFIWVEVEANNLAARRAELEKYVTERAAALRLAIQDFESMRQVLLRLAGSYETLARANGTHAAAYADDARLLRWLLDNHFVLLGMRFLEDPSAAGKIPADLPRSLGIGRFDDWRGLQLEDKDRIVQETGAKPPFLWVRKSRSESWCYKAGRTNHVVAQSYDAGGKPNGFVLLDGLFSMHALASPRTEVPLLDRVIERLYSDLRANKGSHRHRAIRTAFNSLPLEYLFGLSVEDVRQLVERILEADAAKRLQVHLTFDEVQHSAFVFIALPRSHYDDELRSNIRALLKERLKATSVDDGVYAGEGDSVTFHFFFTGVVTPSAEAQTSLAGELEQVASPWSDRLLDELKKRHGAKAARQLHGQYAHSFSARYQEETSIARAVSDIEILEQVGPDKPFDCDLFREKADEPLGITRLRVFGSHGLLLSDVLPILDNFGLVVIDQFPTTVAVPGRPAQVVSTFRLSRPADRTDYLQRRNRLRAAISAVVAGAMDNDPWNRLLLRADISWTQVALVRAYNHYARQLGLMHGERTTREILLRHGDVVRTITELFRAKFDPDIEGVSATAVDERRVELIDRTRRSIEALLEGVTDLTSDQILRTLYNLVDATVRTNFYSRNEGTDAHLVLKFEPARITRMPEPRPYREILVHHPRVAGLHLRGGPVARGGIRWSDRPIDYRTEVLGLVSTQNVKNVVIVPRGAKGAFILKNPPADPREHRAHADAMYKIFISGLLDVTDNLVGGERVTPPRVLRYDDLDHYLVVAADKGTAHLSDTANAIAQGRGFWLGDAFASGGSKGYDHKKEAITARGAWECVKRHFKELGQNPETDRIRVVGIGDMSGDVFGNGMLLSKSMALIAAFDHRHIFLDPNPDPAKSHAARLKLFQTPGSTWEDYAKEAMSPGGGVFPRRAKAIKVSAEARAALGITQDTLSGPELVQAVLRAPVDLLWNGGIGTYVKASTETHLDVGDAANDSVRVDASEVRAHVIGEGGNLGLTQQGRVELAARDVRLNTDALDNSAGVDLSDHEVNLKILLQEPVAKKRITLADRDALMDKVREAVNQSVLANNWEQSRMLSLDALRSKQSLGRFGRAIAFLGERVPFKRRELNFPGERILSQRAQRGEGLLRPELAVLGAMAKLDLKQELAATGASSVGELTEELLAYFPPVVVQKFEREVRAHPLAIHIGRTILTNRLVADTGAAWLSETTLRTGRTTSEILASYRRASALLGAAQLKAAVAQLEAKAPAATEYKLRLLVEDAIERLCSWMLRRTQLLGEELERTMRSVDAALVGMLSADETTLFNSRRAEYAAAGLDDATGARLASLHFVDLVADTSWTAMQGKLSTADAARALRWTSRETGLGPVLGSNADKGNEETDTPADFALRDRLRQNMVELAVAVGTAKGGSEQPSAATQQHVEALRRELAPLLGGSQGLASLVVAGDRIERVLGTLRPPR